MELYKKIITARKKKGLTQEQLADLANVTVRTIQRIESGENSPRSYTLKTIAAALDTSFEELTTTNNNNYSLNNSINPTTTSTDENDKHFLQMLCLSCFSYLLIPFIHFLIPIYLLKRSGKQNTSIVAFARKVIRSQVYWQSALSLLLLLTLAYNTTRANYFQKTYLINYLWPFFMMYFGNAIIITVNLLRIKKADLSCAASI